MNPERTPDDVRELLGAYALDALDPEERKQVDELLLVDPSARAELHELQHAAAWLGHASLRPPERAWTTIAAEVDRDLERDRGEDGEAAVPTPVTGVPPTFAPEHTAPHGPRRRTRHVSRWLIAAAVALVLGIGIAGTVALVDRSSNPSSKLEAALHNESARRVTLHSKDGRWSARAVVLPDGTGYLVDASMPRLPADRSYQLWSLTANGPVSSGLLDGAGRGHEFVVADATHGLAVTDEPHGGSAVPTTGPIMQGSLVTS